MFQKTFRLKPKRPSNGAIRINDNELVNKAEAERVNIDFDFSQIGRSRLWWWEGAQAGRQGG
jgi:hypothetical protein